MDRRRFLSGLAVLPSLSACRRADAPTRAPVIAVTSSPSPRAAPASDVAPVEMFADLTGYCAGIGPVTAAEHAEHRRRLQAALRRRGLAALVVEPGATMTYASGIAWGRSERPFLLVLPAEGEPRFVAPAFEARTAAEQLGDASLTTWHEHENPYAVAIAALPSGRDPFGCDGAMRSFIVEGLRTAAGRRRCEQASDVISAARMHKTTEELARLRRANEATKAALRSAATHVRTGMRQSEVAGLVRAAQIAAGLGDVWVLALAGPAAAFPHGTREDRVLQDGDMILVDTGGALFGYRSDITRTWAIGTASERARTIWQTVAAAQQAAYAAIRPGARCGDVDAAAREVIGAAGWGDGYTAFTHRLGHGIGLEVHEEPYLLPRAEQRLEVGMTMSNEPGIYLPGELGVRLEDIIAVTEDGCEVFGPTVRTLDDPFG